tara:strand:+ start:758 stop:1204 length:447 start_codon:yes stop_codon:yes gene_type:complete
MELLNKNPKMDLSLIADALHEIAVDLKKHTNVKQEMNVEEDDGSPMYPASEEEFDEEILKEQEKIETEEILSKIEVLLKTIIFTKAIGSKGDIYDVDIENMTCTCPAFVYNPYQTNCKHLKKALKYKEDYEKNFQYPKLSELHKKEDY